MKPKAEIPAAPAHRPYVPPVYRPRAEFVDLKDDYNRALRARRRKRTLAQAAVILRDILFALGIGALSALVGTIWFCAATIVILLTGYAGNRYLNTHH